LQSQITQIHNQKLNALLNPNFHESTDIIAYFETLLLIQNWMNVMWH